MSQLAALALTLLVEVPLYVTALTALGAAGPARAAVLGAGVNLLTHPLLWWFLAPTPGAVRLAGAEAAVCAVEALLLWSALYLSPAPRRREGPAVLVAVSVGVNAASVLAGLTVGWVAGPGSGGG